MQIDLRDMKGLGGNLRTEIKFFWQVLVESSSTKFN
jgi:hypothetical protein